MSKITMQDREKALEEEFFRKKEQETLARLREKKARERSLAELRELSGIRDEAVLEKLVEAGVDAHTLMAFTLVPLVVVAWADGSVKDAEREAVLNAAHAAGVGEGSAPYETLERMLRERPSPKLFSAWQEYAAALNRDLPEVDRARVAADVTTRAREVAESAGGFLGVGGVSDAEEAVLRKIEEAFR